MGLYLPPLTDRTSFESGFDILSFGGSNPLMIMGYADGALFVLPNPMFFAEMAMLFSEPGRIAWQKELISNFWTPIFKFAHEVYAMPTGKNFFHQQSSEDVQLQFRRHPELAALIPIFTETVDCLITGPFGFDKSGPGISQRFVNQYVAYCARNDWTVQMTMDLWEATVIAGQCNTTELPAVLPTDPVQRAFSLSLIIPQLIRKLSVDAPLTQTERQLLHQPYINALTQAALYQMQHPSNVLVVPQTQDRLPNQLEIPLANQYDPLRVDQAKDIISRYLTGQRISATDLAWFQDPRNWDIIWSITHGGIDLGPLPDGVSCPFPAQPWPKPAEPPPPPPPQPQPPPPCPIACQCADLALQHQITHLGDVQDTLIIPQLQSQGQSIGQLAEHDQVQDGQVLELQQVWPPIKQEADLTQQRLSDLVSGLPNLITRGVKDFYDAVIRTPLLAALDCCYNQTIKKVQNAAQDICQFGIDCWGLMAECWLNRFTPPPDNFKPTRVVMHPRFRPSPDLPDYLFTPRPPQSQ